MKLTSLLLLTLTSASVVGCATSGNFCDVTTAYRPEPGEVYTDRNKRWIVSFNEFGETKCGWKP